MERRQCNQDRFFCFLFGCVLSRDAVKLISECSKPVPVDIVPLEMKPQRNSFCQRSAPDQFDAAAIIIYCFIINIITLKPDIQ